MINYLLLVCLYSLFSGQTNTDFNNETYLQYDNDINHQEMISVLDNYKQSYFSRSLNSEDTLFIILQFFSKDNQLYMRMSGNDFFEPFILDYDETEKEYHISQDFVGHLQIHQYNISIYQEKDLTTDIWKKYFDNIEIENSDAKIEYYIQNESLWPEYDPIFLLYRIDCSGSLDFVHQVFSLP